MSLKEQIAKYAQLYATAELQKLQRDATRTHLVISLRLLQLANEVVARQSSTMNEAVLFRLIKEYTIDFFDLLRREPAFAEICALEIGGDLFLTPQKIITSQDPEYQTLQQEQILTFAKVQQLLQ